MRASCVLECLTALGTASNRSGPSLYPTGTGPPPFRGPALPAAQEGEPASRQRSMQVSRARLIC
jgi:hypothetical protein